MLLHKKYIMITILFLLTSINIITVASGGKQSTTSSENQDVDISENVTASNDKFDEGYDADNSSGPGSSEYVPASDEECGKDYVGKYSNCIYFNYHTLQGHQSPESSEIVPTSGQGANNDYVGKTPCYAYMKLYCKKENPEAIDFVKIAITNLIDDDIQNLPHIRQYYFSFQKFLDAEGILSPDEYCLKFEPEEVPVEQKEEENISDDAYDEDELMPIDNGTPCQKALRMFGDSNHQALQYGFYQTKVNPRKCDRVDTIYMLRVAVYLGDQKDYSGNYLKYMAENVKLKGEFESPLEFCQSFEF